MSRATSTGFGSAWDWRFGIAVLLIGGSILGLNVLSHGSSVMSQKKLTDFPQTLGLWQGRDVAIEARVQEVLGATDLLNRVYFDPDNRAAELFVAFFASQRKGGAIHSPKNCLPGAGWSVVKGDIISLSVPGHSEPFQVNRYIVQKDFNRVLVLYWYQSQGRVLASEYAAKLYLIWDAIRKNRTDGALVRVVSHVVGNDEGAALERAKDFVQQIFPQLENYLPSSNLEMSGTATESQRAALKATEYPRAVRHGWN